MFQKIKRVLKLAYYWKKYHKLGVQWSDGVELGGFSSTFEGCNRLGRNSSFTGRLGAAIWELIVKSTLILADIARLLRRYAQSVGVTLHPIGSVRHLCFIPMNVNVECPMLLKNYLMSHRKKPSSEMMFGLVPVQ